MSRCRCCDKILNKFELTRKNSDTGVYLDMCSVCFKESGIGKLVHVTERPDLLFDEDDAYNEDDCKVDSYEEL